MRAAASLETLECEAREVVESEAPRADPQTRLQVGPRTWRPELRACVLSNAWLRAVFVPDLGVRLIGLRHEPSGSEVLAAPSVLAPVSSWEIAGPTHVRDAALWEGLQFLAPATDAVRTPSLGPVDFALEEPDADDEPARAVFGGLMPGVELGFQVVASLEPDRAELVLDVRLQNRGLEEPVWCWSAWGLGSGGAGWNSSDGEVSALYDSNADAGVALIADPRRVAHRQDGDGWLERGRHGLWLVPRQVEQWSLRVVPLAGLGSLCAASKELFVGLQGCALRLLAVAAHPGAKVFVLDAEGATLEASVDLEAGTAAPLDLPGEPRGLVVRDASGVELLRWEPGAQPPPARRPAVSAAAESLREPAEDTCERAYRDAARRRAAGEDPGAELADAADSPMLRSLCSIQAAMHALRCGDPEFAVHRLEDALGHNAEDALAWWLKAVAQRLAGHADEEAPELPNAHFLTPLEPALRAEALLGQPLSLTSEPNPLVAPLAAFPDHALEAVALLVDCGLWSEAARLIDELLRHEDLPLLRQMLAFCHLRATGMEAEAADQIRRAAASTVRGPKPWRGVELLAIEALRERGLVR